jgi:serine protease Do
VVAVLFASTLSVGAIGFEAETAYESVFVIYSGNSLGSGFAVGENCIVTNAHVIDNPRSITVETYGGTKYKASVLGMNEQQDIAVLIVKDAQFPYLDIADMSTMKTGDDIYAIGAPKGMAYTLTKGGVSAKERMIRNQSYIQIDAAINEGNSGGPLLNDAGQVLGMNTLKMSDSEGIGLAIPISRVCEYLKSLGIELNTNGNVVDSVEIPEETKPSDTKPGNDNENKEPSADHDDEQRTPAITYIAVVIAALSLAVNVVLTVLLINEKKKSTVVPYDPSERTDFDIDILE